MTTLQLLFWIFTSYGLMNILVFGSIFKPQRDFIEFYGQTNAPFSNVALFVSALLACPMCTGFWTGLFLSLSLWSPAHALYDTPRFYLWFFDAIFSSGVVWIINSVTEWFEEFRVEKLNVKIGEQDG